MEVIKGLDVSLRIKKCMALLAGMVAYMLEYPVTFGKGDKQKQKHVVYLHYWLHNEGYLGTPSGCRTFVPAILQNAIEGLTGRELATALIEGTKANLWYSCLSTKDDACLNLHDLTVVCDWLLDVRAKDSTAKSLKGYEDPFVGVWDKSLSRRKGKQGTSKAHKVVAPSWVTSELFEGLE